MLLLALDLIHLTGHEEDQIDSALTDLDISTSDHVYRIFPVNHIQFKN